MQTEVHPAIIAVAAVLLLGLVGFLFYRSGAARGPSRSHSELRQQLPRPRIPPLESSPR